MAAQKQHPTKEIPDTALAGAKGEKSPTTAPRQQLTEGAPDIDPLGVKADSSEFADGPTALSATLLRETADMSGGAPMLAPPTEAEIETAEVAGIAAWHNAVKIVALWSNKSNRNSYISVPGLGWKKLSNVNDSSVVSMTMLAAHAEQTNANVNIRTGADGMIHEIYVW